jgi:hypothetical protein
VSEAAVTTLPVKKRGRPFTKNVPRETKPTQIVQPIIKDSRIPHPLEVLESEGKFPDLTAVGILNLGSGTKYVSYVLKTKGDKIVSLEVTEPDMKAIAVESLKTEVVLKFIDPESDTGEF